MIPANVFVLTPEVPNWKLPPDVAAAAVAATFAAVETPPVVPPIEPPADGAEMLGMLGTEVETVGVLIVGTLTVGVEILPTFGKKRIAL
jgi:hypothetical protein